MTPEEKLSIAQDNNQILLDELATQRDQLAAKEREIERLSKEKDKWAELAGSFTQSHHAKLKEIEGYKQQITHLTSQLAEYKTRYEHLAVGAQVNPNDPMAAVCLKLDRQLATVREAAIKFAQNVRRNGRWQEDEWIEAGKFLEQAHAAHDATTEKRDEQKDCKVCKTIEAMRNLPKVKP